MIEELSIKFTITGTPQPKKTHRTRSVFSKGRAISINYAHPDNRRAERYILSQILNELPPEPLKGPIIMNVVYYMPVLKSFPKWKKAFTECHDLPHIVKPDTDNLNKMLGDAFTKAGVYTDDAVVYQFNAKKIYSSMPRTEVKLIKLKEITTDDALSFP